MAGVLRALAETPAPSEGIGDLDHVIGSVELFVQRAVEAICRAEAAVPEERRPPEMRLRLREARRHIDRLEQLLVRARSGDLRVWP